MFNQVDRQRLIADIHEAFAHRRRPRDAFWSMAEEEVPELVSLLDRVTPRELAYEDFVACGGDDISLMSNLTLPMQLYFAPAFMVIVVNHVEEIEWLPSLMVQWFRPEPGGWLCLGRRRMPPERVVDDLKAKIAHGYAWADGTPFAVRDLQDWFFHPRRPWENRHLALLTDSEIAVFDRFFAFLLADSLEYRLRVRLDDGRMLDNPDSRLVLAARALLQGGALARTLGALTTEDCAHMADILEMLHRKWPHYFPEDRAAPVVAELRAAELPG